jgi:hypothetical protein
MALKSTRPLTGMSTRKCFWGVEHDRAGWIVRGWNDMRREMRIGAMSERKKAMRVVYANSLLFTVIESSCAVLFQLPRFRVNYKRTVSDLINILISYRKL